MRTLGFWLLLTLVAGCGGTVQTYEGPKKATHEVALLKTNVGELTFDTVWIDQVDGNTLIRAYTVLEVMPGRRSVRVQLNSGILRASRIVAFDAKSGRAYRAKGSFSRGSAYAWIEDEESREIVAGERP